MNSPTPGPACTPRAIAAPNPANASRPRRAAIRSACCLASTRAGAPDRSFTSAVSAATATTAAAATTAATVAVTARRALLTLARRRVLRPLDQLLGLDEVAVLVLGDELQADPAAVLVHLLHDHVEHVSARDHVLDVGDAAGADVGNVQQA